MFSDCVSDDSGVIEGGPLEGVQCGEKMWLVVDINSMPYVDAQFLVTGMHLTFFCEVLDKIF
jgi:hypothetical protein